MALFPSPAQDGTKKLIQRFGKRLHLQIDGSSIRQEMSNCLPSRKGVEMHIFRQPPECQVRRLLSESKLPAIDLTPEHFQHFFGCGPEQAPKGIVGLEIFGSEALLRSLAVDEHARGLGCGNALVAQAERHAQERGARRIYLLTTTAASFFERLGYRTVARDDAPECIRVTQEFSSLCPSSSVFMAKDLTANPCVQPPPESFA